MRLLLATTGVVLAVAAPAGGAVRVTFGSALKAAPTAEPPATCDPVTGRDLGPCTRIALGFPAGGAVVGQIRAPVGGTIRRVRLRSAVAGVVRITLARVAKVERDGSGGTARVVSRGVLVHLRGRGTPESFRVKLKVRRGDHLALQGTSFGPMACAGDTDAQLLFQPALRPFAPAESTELTDACTLLVQATVTAKSR